MVWFFDVAPMQVELTVGCFDAQLARDAVPILVLRELTVAVELLVLVHLLSYLVLGLPLHEKVLSVPFTFLRQILEVIVLIKVSFLLHLLQQCDCIFDALTGFI